MHKKINLTVYLSTVILIFLLSRVLTFLPDSFYFGFNKIVEQNSTEIFFVSPPRISSADYWEIPTASYETIFEEYKNQGLIGEHESLYGDYGYNKKFMNIFEEKEKVKIGNDIINKGEYHFWISLFLKLLPPFFVGFLSYFIWKEDSISPVSIGAGTAAFLLCWPVIVLWGKVVNDTFKDDQLLFYVLYTMYIILYYNIAKFGCLFGKALYNMGFNNNSTYSFEWGRIISTFITSGAMAISSWLISLTITTK